KKEAAPETTKAPSSTTVTRRTVGKPDEAEFLTPVRKAVAKSPAKVGYTSAKRKVNTKSKKNTDKSLVSYLVKFGWAFCTFLLFRLVFSGGGVMDYYSSLNLLEDKQYEQQRIIKENKQLALEIKKIGKNSMYQKKLVRDNLGFIAKDEYLILFPREKSLSQR
uniref:FtsB family cell division protein n=1 Tax=Halobacteriovorax sp. TaxID=2020862 RepID=UPI003569388A